ncbi:hypothetical protein RDWZM_006483 [Blomia tropicalis]|uniref:Uncharacterized protein n=1 Tax=Blomia tropicalis TaxID=40697 RepID=A0A9Q0RNG0_BLOTA|nr:hypothetical protein RDWZM_006483 [Blomia tropicalis]
MASSTVQPDMNVKNLTEEQPKQQQSSNSTTVQQRFNNSNKKKKNKKVRKLKVNLNQPLVSSSDSNNQNILQAVNLNSTIGSNEKSIDNEKPKKTPKKLKTEKKAEKSTNNLNQLSSLSSSISLKKNSPPIEQPKSNQSSIPNAQNDQAVNLNSNLCFNIMSKKSKVVLAKSGKVNMNKSKNYPNKVYQSSNLKSVPDLNLNKNVKPLLEQSNSGTNPFSTNLPSTSSKVVSKNTTKPANETRKKFKILKRLHSYLRNPNLPLDFLFNKKFVKIQNNDSFESKFLCDIITSQMQNLSKQLDKNNFNYLDMVSKQSETFCYDSNRVKELIKLPNLFTSESIENFEKVLLKYERIHPPEILKIRGIIDDLLFKKSLQKRFCENELCLEMITCRKIDSGKLHGKVKACSTFEKQLKIFIDEIALPLSEIKHRNQLINAFEEKIQCIFSEESNFLEFKLFIFGSLANGLATIDSDLDIVIQFANLKQIKLDFETCIHILRCIKKILTNRFNFHGNLCQGLLVIHSKRCPILKMDFSLICPDFANQVKFPIQYNKCDLSISSIYGVYNSRLLKFLTEFEPRFYQMTMLLKYWAKQNGLINTEAFSSYAFTMMIIFYLQTESILPSISHLQNLARDHSMQEILIDGYHFEFCDQPELIQLSQINERSIEELVLGFFNYYNEFKYGIDAICPRLGSIVSRVKLFNEKRKANLKEKFRNSAIVIEDPFVLEHNCGSIFQNLYMEKWLRVLKQVLKYLSDSPIYCIAILTDQSRFDLAPPKDEWIQFKDSLKYAIFEWNKKSHNESINEPTLIPKVFHYKKFDIKMIRKHVLQIEEPSKQIETLISLIKLPESIRESRIQWIGSLQHELNSNFYLSQYEPKIVPFGSHSSDLSLINSDLNLNLDFSKINKSWNLYKLSYSLLETLLINQIRLDIRKMQIRKPTQSLVQLTWKEDKDISYNQLELTIINQFVEKQSKWINILCQIEPRFYQMTLVLKFWAKQTEIMAPKDRQTVKMTGYALTLLIIYFLQNVENPILCSYEEMSSLLSFNDVFENSNEEEIQIDSIDSNDENITNEQDLLSYKNSTNKTSTEQLLVDFFKFYQQFPYDLQVVCPRFGSNTELAEKLYNEKKLTSTKTDKVVIEDPIEKTNYGFRGPSFLKWKSVIDRYFNYKLTPMNVVDKLIDPNLW